MLILNCSVMKYLFDKVISIRKLLHYSLFLSPCSIPACFQPPLPLASRMTPSPCHHLPAICGPLMRRLVTHHPISHLLKSHHLTHHKERGGRGKTAFAIEISVNILYLYFTVGGSGRIQKIIANKNIRSDCPFFLRDLFQKFSSDL